MREFLVFVLFSLSVAAGSVAAQPAFDHTVQAGAVNPMNPLAPYAYTDFYPRTLDVHRGQTVRWVFPNVGGDVNRAFHTVTFMPGAHPPYFRPDELRESLALSEETIFPSGCGRRTQPVCEVRDTTTFVSSGTPIGWREADGSIAPFFAKIMLDPRPLPYRYHCTIHRQMHGYIRVVPDDQPLSNLSAAEIAAQILADTRAADALREARSAARFDQVEGRRVWHVTVGEMTTSPPSVPGGPVPDGGVVILAMMPDNLQIATRDAVRFNVVDELHTVTFPDAIDRTDPSFAPACDPDEPDSGLPGVPGFACPPGWSFEIVLTRLADELRAPGDAVTRGSVHHSGLMTAADAPEWVRGRPPGTGRFTPSMFEANFPQAGAFGFRCQVHIPFMTGSVTVS